MKFFFVFAILLGCYCSINGQSASIFDIDEEYKKGIKAMNNYQYQKAKDHFYECYRVDFKNEEYLKKLAFCQMKIGDYSEAKFSYKALLKKDSASVNAWSNLGSIYEKEMNYSKASKCYQELLMIDSTNSFYFRQNAMMALRTNLPLLAFAHFNRAHELNERDLVVINELARLNLHFGLEKEAERVIEKGLSFSPKNFRLLYTKADVLHRNQNYKEIVKTLSQVMSMGDTIQYYQKMIGAAYLHLEQYDSCIFHLNQIVMKGQETDLTFYQLAIAYRGMEDFEASEEAYQAAIKKGISANVGTYYKNLALLLDEQKKLKEAIAAWKKAIEFLPKERVYLFYLAKDCDTYYRDKKIALRYYQKYYKSNHEQYREYVKERIQYLKELIHQQKKKSK